MNAARGKAGEGLRLSARNLALLCCLYVALSFMFVSASAAANYTYTALLPPGWTFAYATSINNSGVVVGLGSQGTSIKAFIYSGGACTQLLPTGWSSVQPSAINDSGVVVSFGYDGGVPEGFMYDGATCTGLLPDGWTFAQANSINNSGVVVGAGVDAAGAQKGFVYSGGIYTELMPTGWTSAFVTSVNDSGVVVGWGTVPDAAGGPPIMKGFIAFPPSPEDEIADIIDFIDGSLVGGTATGDCGKVQLKGAEKLLTKAAHAIEKGKTKKACNELDDAYDRVNRHLKSRKACVAEVAAEIEEQIQDVMQDLGCKEQGCRH